ncbi:MAG: hypothetical protein ACW98Y_20160 [Candidatus Thorarchaeota archaeon]
MVELGIKGVSLLLQVSPQILILSIISTIATIAVILIVLYILLVSGFPRKTEEYQTRIPSDSTELFLLLKDWEPGEYKTLLSSFLLHDEYVVLEILLTCLEEDNLSTTINEGTIELVGDGGWRNRNQIANKSSLSNRRVYGKSGIIDRLVELELIQKRENPKPWGRQTFQYRANVTHPLVKSMFHALNGHPS